MATKDTLSNTMRIWHRYLGFFLAGIMAVYAFSGIIMIFRTTDFLKKEVHEVKQLEPNLKDRQVGEALKMRVMFEPGEGAIKKFKEGTYNSETGEVDYTKKSYPFIIEKFTRLHKATAKEPLFFLNVFFGVSLLFFVLSSFWMFMPKTSIFKKGMYFTLAGIVLTLIMLFV